MKTQVRRSNVPKCFVICTTDGVPVGKSIHAYSELRALNLWAESNYPVSDLLHLSRNLQCKPLTGKCQHQVLAEATRIKKERAKLAKQTELDL